MPYRTPGGEHQCECTQDDVPEPSVPMAVQGVTDPLKHVLEGHSERKVAERTGLEPATPGVTGRYSNQLNYRSEWGRES